MNKVQYSAFFIDEPGTLKSMFPPIYPNLYYHHLTIEFAPQSTANLEVGRKVNLKIIGRITTNKVDALLVDNSKSRNKYPHITLSTAQGVKPVESNNAFENHPELIVRFNQPQYIAATEGFYANDKEVKSWVL